MEPNVDHERDPVPEVNELEPNNKNRFEILMMSEAGKPIYSYSKREDAITLMPLCSALINYASKTQNETLMSMKTSDNLMVSFTTRYPLIIIVIYEADSHIDPLMLVEQVVAQIVSILTAKTLKTVFEDRPTLDLKKMLYGSEKLIDSMTNLVVSLAKLEGPCVQSFLAVTSSSTVSSNSADSAATNQPGAGTLPTRPHRMLVPNVTMPSSSRDQLHNILSSVISANSKNMVFSLLFRVIPKYNDLIKSYSSRGIDDGLDNSMANSEESRNVNQDIDQMNNVSFQLITVCNHHPKHKLKISDIHIILALLIGSKAQLSSAESLWMPVCLPRFNPDAFLHSYIAYINKMKNCLVMFSVDRDEFSNCQAARNTIEQKLDVILNDPAQTSKFYYDMSPLVHPVLLELQDKEANNSSTEHQLPDLQNQSQIYNSKSELFHARKLQFLWYQTSKQVLWWQRSTKKHFSPILLYVTKKMLKSSLRTLWLKLADKSVFLGWHVPTLQIYTQFDDTITTHEATEVIQRITTWIKKEEDNFSIKDYR